MEILNQKKKNNDRNNTSNHRNQHSKMENRKIKFGDRVTDKSGKNKGLVSFVYPSDFVDVVWNVDSRDWGEYTSSKELVNQLVFEKEHSIEETIKEHGTKLINGKIELSYKSGFFTVENNALKVKTVTQSKSFESALQAFLSEGK